MLLRAVTNRKWLGSAVLLAAAVALTGCPGGYYPPGNDYPPGGGGNPGGETPQEAYDRGFDVGFAMDDWYWTGYDDGFATQDTYIYYDVSGIPYYQELSYRAGYWDGVWTAYNDGYWVDYEEAFVLGFSEGYDAAYYPDYLEFLANDVHVEYLHGGWVDGYNDGFSEGRVFGASDYESGIAFDWEGALADYQAGVDLYFEEIDVGTGAYGPVILYEYGLDPNTLKARKTQRSTIDPPSIRQSGLKSADDSADRARPMSPQAEAYLDVRPETTERSDKPVRLDTTWLERIQAYHESKKAATPTTAPDRARAVVIP